MGDFPGIFTIEHCRITKNLLFHKNSDEMHAFNFISVNEMLAKILKHHNRESPFSHPPPHFTSEVILIRQQRQLTYVY